MSAAADRLTYERVLPLVFYDALAGNFRRRQPSGLGVYGPPMGFSKVGGYVELRVDGMRVLAHRLAWLAYHGAWPTGEIDHINGVKHDNRIENLRDVDHTTNTQNITTKFRKSISGLLGAAFHKPTGKYQAEIRAGGKRINLGLFDTMEAAHEAYINAKRKLHPGNTL